MTAPIARHLTVAVLVSALALAACGGGRRDLVVFAASSLGDVFAELEAEFEAAHPDVDVIISVGGSASLAAQIESGAPVDVFAAADTRTMQRVVEAGLIDGSPRVLAHNRLAIAVAPGNPEGVEQLADLGRRELIVVLAAPEVPAGAYSARVLELSGVTVAPASYEQSVRSVATKIALGEADAGIVYRTDVAASDGDLAEVVIPRAQNIEADYPIAVTLDAGPDAAAFVETVLGPSGRRVLAEAGFELS